MSVGNAIRTHPGSMKNSRFHVDEMPNSITKYNRKLVVNMLCSVAVLPDGCVFFYVVVVRGGVGSGVERWEQTGRSQQLST
jgi:hypothetical protein